MSRLILRDIATILIFRAQTGEWGRAERKNWVKETLRVFQTLYYAPSTFFSELCCRKGMVAYTMPQQRKREESKRLRGERDRIKFIGLRFERWQFVGFSELCCGKGMVAYTKPQQRKREESKRLRGERSDQVY